MTRQFSRIFFSHKDVCLDQSDHEIVCLVFSDLILGKTICEFVLFRFVVYMDSININLNSHIKNININNNNKNDINRINVIGLVAGMDAITRTPEDHGTLI